METTKLLFYMMLKPIIIVITKRLTMRYYINSVFCIITMRLLKKNLTS